MLKPGSTPGMKTMSSGATVQPYVSAMSETICSRNAIGATA